MQMIPVYRPWIGLEEAEATKRPIMSGWVTQGPEVAAFEKEFAAFVGAKHAIAVSNCTTALHLALKVAGVTCGDEVLTVSHSYIATANSIRYLGATPVFVDVEVASMNIDPSKLEESWSPKCKAILVVHQVGMPCDLKGVLEFAERKNLIVIEDAACAVGSEILWNGEWQKIGRPHGHIATFSLHPRKLLTTGDGGFLTTSNDEWNVRFRSLRQHAMSVTDAVRHSSSTVILEDYSEVGYNYRLTDIQAAVGRVQLQRLPELIARRRQQVERYRSLLSDLPLTFQVQPEWAKSNWQSLGVLIGENVDQVTLMQFLLDRNISTRSGIMNAHTQPAYQAQDGGPQPWRSCGLSHSEAARNRYILLPLYHDLTDEQMDHVCASLHQFDWPS